MHNGAGAVAAPSPLHAIYATMASSSSAAEIIDVCDDTDEDEPQPPKRQKAAEPQPKPIERIDLPGGVLDPSLLKRVTHIAQQSNCVGCDGRGLAQGVADALPYGCPYKDRRRQTNGPNVRDKFAIQEDRTTPGTINVRKPAFPGVGRPTVICIFGQFEMGPPDKYNRVQPRPPEGDSAKTREGWFQDALNAIRHELQPPPESIAFPHEIGCGLAGGDWSRYNAMIQDFAQRMPHTQVIIARWMGGGGGGTSSGRGGGPHRGRGRGGGQGGGNRRW